MNRMCMLTQVSVCVMVTCITNLTTYATDNSDDDDDDDDDATLATQKEDGVVVSSPKPGTILAPAVSVATGGGGGGPEPTMETTTGWNPICIKFTYKDRDQKNHQVVVLLLTGGVWNQSRKDLELKVVDKSLWATIPWSDYMDDMDSLLIHLDELFKSAWNFVWKVAKEDHGRLEMEKKKMAYAQNFMLASLEFKNQVKRNKSNNPIKKLKATAVIPLDIDVEKELTDCKRQFVADDKGMRMLYVDMKEKSTETDEDVEMDDQEIKIKKRCN